MKKVILFAVAALMAASMSAQSGKELYKKYFDRTGVETVHISGFMLRAAGRLSAVDMGGKDFSRFARSLKGMYVISAESPEARVSLGADIRHIIRKGDMESIMEANSDGQKVMMYIDGNDDEVVGMVCVNDPVEETIMVVSENGYGKRSEVEDYRKTNRGTKGVKTLAITEKTGRLVAIKVVTDENDLMIINKSGILIRLKVADVRVMGRATQGVRLINLAKKNDVIASVCKVMHSQAEEEDIEEAEIADEAQTSGEALTPEAKD